MNMNKEQIVHELNKLIQEGKEIAKTKFRPIDINDRVFVRLNTDYYVDGVKYKSWLGKTMVLLEQFLSKDNQFYCDLNTIKNENNYLYKLEICIEYLTNINNYINSGIILTTSNSNDKTHLLLDIIFSHFHTIANQ
jgi:hypothetical protein